VPQSGTAGLERVTDGESRTGAGGVGDADDAMLAIRVLVLFLLGCLHPFWGGFFLSSFSSSLSKK
jgi:hypothetical protein